MPPANAIFFSIRPQYVSKIFEGTKTVELRRVRPKYIAKGALVLIYVPSPLQSLVGAFKVDQVVEMPLEELWDAAHERAGITREEFDTYYEGASTGVAIFFSQVWNLREPIELQDLKANVGFQPPQGFRYAKASELASPRLAELVADTKTMIQSSFMPQKN